MSLSPYSFQISGAASATYAKDQQEMKDILASDVKPTLSRKLKGIKTTFQSGIWNIELIKLKMVDISSPDVDFKSDPDFQCKLDDYPLRQVQLTVNEKFRNTVSNAFFRQLQCQSSLFDDVIISFIDYLRTIDLFSRHQVKRPRDLNTVTEEAPVKRV